MGFCGRVGSGLAIPKWKEMDGNIKVTPRLADRVDLVSGSIAGEKIVGAAWFSVSPVDG